MELQNHYKTLQVDPAAEPEVIGAAYRRLAQKYHPDVNPLPNAKLRMQAINHAYDVLRDPLSRTRHDAELAAQVSPVPQSTIDEQRLQTAVEAARRQALQEWQQQARTTAARRRSRMWLAVVFLSVACISVGATAFALVQPRWAKPQRIVAGSWDGEWLDPAGQLLSYRFKIRVTDRNDAGGTAIWILKNTSGFDEQLQVGRQATVYVKGSFDPQYRFISMGSYRQDDPYNIVDVDEYRLYLSPDGSTLSGEIYDDGVWLGKVIATRQQ